jgi:transcriptional regulator with XRE-family HTH domain
MRVFKIESDNMLIWLGTGIAGRRVTAGLTRRQLAGKAHLKTSVIDRLECGDYDLTVRELYAIARALGTNLGDMVY